MLWCAVATGSKAGGIGMTVPFIILAYSMCLNSVAAASRQAWAFARDEGLPFPAWFQKVTVVHGTHLPLNAMIATLVVALALALINLGGVRLAFLHRVLIFLTVSRAKCSTVLEV